MQSQRPKRLDGAAAAAVAMVDIAWAPNAIRRHRASLNQRQLLCLRSQLDVRPRLRLLGVEQAQRRLRRLRRPLLGQRPPLAEEA